MQFVNVPPSLPSEKHNQKLAQSTPSRRAGIVSFSYVVSLIGDGSSTACGVGHESLLDMRALIEAGRSYPLSQAVSQTHQRLSDILFGLSTDGGTALGPAVVAGLSMLKVLG